MRLPLALCLIALPAALLAAGEPQPLVFFYGAQDPEAIGRVADLGATALYLDLGTEDTGNLPALDARVDLAAQHGLKVIIAIPTVPTSLNLASLSAERYRAHVADLITQVVTHFRDTPAVVAWATGDFLEDGLEYNATDFRAFMQRRYADIPALNAFWGSRFGNWGDVTELSAREVDKSSPFGVGRASVDCADFRREVFHDVMAHWAGIIKALDPSRPLMTGRVSLYRGLTAIPREYDIVCPYTPPDALDPDPVAHNVQAVDMARRAGAFRVIPCLQVPLDQSSYSRGDLRRWIGLAGLHGAVGVGLADWQRIEESAAPSVIRREVQRSLVGLVDGDTFRVRPQPTIAFLYEPYAGAFERDGNPVYGYIQGLSEGEPNNPYWSFRLGCRFGQADFLTLDDLPATDLSRYGVVMAPMPLSLPPAAQRQIDDYVRTGGAFVCDLGAGMYETGSWLELPPPLAGLFGVEHLGGMEDVFGDLSVSWTPPWFPSLRHGVRTKGSLMPKAPKPEEGSAVPRKPRHVFGPACYARVASTAGALATLAAKPVDGKWGIEGIISNETGLGITCFATHRLWANWVSGEPVYEAFHHDLCARRPRIELLDVPMWTQGICASATDDGIAVLNGRAAPAGADVLYYDAASALYTDAYCLYSASARKPDGTRSGAARLSVAAPGTTLVACHRLPVLVEPYTATCLARLLEQSATRLVLEVGGDGAVVAANRDGVPVMGAGEPTEVRFTIRGGAYPIAPGTVHHVAVDTNDAAGAAYDITATGDGEIRFSGVIGHAVVTITPR